MALDHQTQQAQVSRYHSARETRCHHCRTLSLHHSPPATMALLWSHLLLFCTPAGSSGYPMWTTSFCLLLHLHVLPSFHVRFYAGSLDALYTSVVLRTSSFYTSFLMAWKRCGDICLKLVYWLQPLILQPIHQQQQTQQLRLTPHQQSQDQHRLWHSAGHILAVFTPCPLPTFSGYKFSTVSRALYQRVIRTSCRALAVRCALAMSLPVPTPSTNSSSLLPSSASQIWWQ